MTGLHRAALLALLGLGLGLRLCGLEAQILWHDEIYTKFFVSGHRAAEWKAALFTGQILDVSEVLAFQTHSEDKGLIATVLGLAHDEPQHPPLYYALLRVWIMWFGDGTGAIRMLSVLCGVLIIPAMYWFARELYASGPPEQDPPLTPAAIIAAALVTTSPLFVRYAQEAREYALWSVLVLAASAALFRAIRNPENLRSWIVFSALTAISLYTSLSTVAVMGAQALFILLRERARFTRTSIAAAAALAGSLLLFLPWIFLIFEHFESFQASMAWSGQIVVPRFQIVSTLGMSVSRPFLDFVDEPDNLAAALIIASVLFFLASAFFSLRRAPRDARIYLIVLSVFPVCLLLVPDLVFGGIRSVSTRYLMPSLLALLAAAAFWLRTRPIAALVLLSLGFGNSLYNTTRPSWTKGISMSLPLIAESINRADRPLVVGNMERHHPGNLIALCHLLKPGTKLQFLDHGVRYNVPRDFDVFLFSPIPPFLDDLKSREHRSTTVLFEDLHASLHRVDPLDPR